MAESIEEELDALLAEGGEEAPVVEEDILAPPTEDVASAGQDALQQTLANLGPEEQELVALHMTPEIVQVISLLFGEAAGQALSGLVNPEMLLVPVPREQALAEAEQAPAQAAPAPAGQPAQPVI